jgi:tripartite-type tricarboxylate transporter receptor subunit TctC
MHSTLRRLATRSCLAIGAILFAQSLPVSAQTYPARPIRLIVPWAAGTPADVAGRIVAGRLGAGLGQPVVVDNRPGAGGLIGFGEAVRQPADGYTLYMLSSASLVAPLLFPTQQADFLGALDPVGMVVWSYNVLVVPTDSPLRNATDIVTAARAKPGAMNFPSGGNGTPAHLAGELFKQQTGIQATHVPYQQFPMAIGDLVGGRMDYMFLTASAAVPQITGGKLRPLATTGAQRLPALKDVPTMTEQGYKDFVLRSFDGMLVRKGTPPEIVERLSAELGRTLADADVRDRLGVLALEPEAMPPARFGATIATEQEKWLRIGRAAQIRAD